MIELWTGQPGAGKTLFVLESVAARAKAEGRDVYFSGIPELKVPGWIELEDVSTWHQLPTGAIIVIDEAQRHFRPRATGAHVPPHVAAAETHRHRGHDLILVTQHPKLIDTNMRRLTGRHVHVMRAFGTKAAVLHEWNEVRPDPDLSREGSIATTRRYPVEVFGWYKSAEVHTHKARVPLRMWLLIASPFMLFGVAWVVWAMLAGLMGGAGATMEAASKGSGGGSDGAASRGSGKAESMTVGQYLAAHQPRLPGLPHTAPIYDEVTRPKVAPWPAGCVAMGKHCRCYTDQGTALAVDAGLCGQIVERGFFRADLVQSQKAVAGPEGPKASSGAAVAPAPVSSPTVVAVPPDTTNDPGGYRFQRTTGRGN